VLEGTDPGIVMGTAGYMSPEQVRGLPVDHRSDIFSLGCVLYEMVTGRRAFARATAADTMAAILTEEPPDPSSIEKVVPAPLSRAIAHCLEKQPEERFQSARDLAFELRAILADTGGTTARRGLSGIRGRRRAVWLAVGSVAIVLIAVGVFLSLRSMTRKPAVVLDPKRIVVAVFENQTGDSSLDPLGRMASDWITQGISQITSVVAVPTSATIQAERGTPSEGRAGRRADPLLALAEETGAGTVVSGTYYLQGSNLQFQARVNDVTGARLISALEPVAGTREEPMKALDALRQRVMGVIASRFDARFSFGFSKPPLFEAYREYVAGLELFGEDYTQSIRHFEKAAEIDPEFFSPQLYIASAYGNQGDYARADAIIRRVNENREKLTPVERQLLDWYRASLAGHGAEALDVIQQVRRLMPRSTLLAYLVGNQALGLNMPQKTVDTFTRQAPEGLFDVHTITGSWRFIVLTQAYHMLSNYERELEVADQAIRALPDLVTVRGGKVRALAALGRVEEVNRTIDESLGISSRSGSPGDLMLQASWELRAHGHREEALRVAARAADWLRSRPPSERAKEAYRPALANAFYAGEKWDEARAIYEQLAAMHPLAGGYKGPPEAQAARQDLPESLRVSRAIDYLGALGTLAARRGDRSEAERISDELARIEQPFLYGWHTYWRACIASLLGEKQQAVDLLRESFAQGNSYDVNLHRDMDLEPLWDCPPFQELLKPKG
jgi:tetratricopeptide (TPR) repeat protein